MRQMQNASHYCHALILRLLNILYPSRCPLCRGVSDVISYLPICAFCWSKIEQYMGPSCRVCALPVSSKYSEICGQCLKKEPPFSRVYNFGLYEGVLAAAINHLKFHGIKRLSKPLGRLLLRLDFPDMDGIVPVPLSRKRLKERGFNQSLLMAREISEKAKIPILMDILVKNRETPPQTGLSARERLVNLKNAFEVKGDIRELRILLFDDVMTTGATVTECSKKLMKAGAKEVSVLTLARSRSD